MYDLIVIGGGPAGAAAAITAIRQGARVLLLERGRLPRHKVCGEFVSAESLALLQSLLSSEAALIHHAPRIGAARLFLDGRTLRAPVDPAAASISRFDLDLALWRAAQAAGVDARLYNPVETLTGAGPFTVQTAHEAFTSRSIINAAGRWSNLKPQQLPNPRTKWLGIKSHFCESNPPASVDLYFFEGGYCGVQAVSPSHINVAAMARSDRATTLAAILELHPELRRRSRHWTPAAHPVTTSPLLFGRPEPVRGNVLLAGDAAGFIDPFVGDGIALALRTGAAAAECLTPFWQEEISLPEAAISYQRIYERRFAPVFRNAARFRRLLTLPAPLRAPFVRLLEHTGLPGFVVRSTRGALR